MRRILFFWNKVPFRTVRTRGLGCNRIFSIAKIPTRRKSAFATTYACDYFFLRNYEDWYFVPRWGLNQDFKDLAFEPLHQLSILRNYEFRQLKGFRKELRFKRVLHDIHAVFFILAISWLLFLDLFRIFWEVGNLNLR